MDYRSQVTIWTGQMLHAVNHQEKYSLYTVPCSRKTSLKNRCKKLILALNVTLLVLNLKNLTGHCYFFRIFFVDYQFIFSFLMQLRS